MMRIGFLGIQCDNPNLGVAALAYAGVDLVRRAAPAGTELVIFSHNTPAGLRRLEATLGLPENAVRAVPFRHRSPRRLLASFRELAACDAVVDFTGGDSFADIYGSKRLLKVLLHKQLVIWGRTPLVLAPQTYGPFAGRLVLPWVRHVLRRATLLFSRDAGSAGLVSGLIGREALLTTDVAVTLPFRAAADDGDFVALNVSGLLWNGGYTGANQFGLATDYRSYCRRLIAELLRRGQRVVLVAHVVPDETSDGEGEAAACRLLNREFPETSLAPLFASPVEAKSWLSGAAVFIGARMHATIAAFTSGVATVPVAYSQKFKGLFGSLGYDPLVDLVALETQDAVDLTVRLAVDEREALCGAVARSDAEAQRRIMVFSRRLTDFLATLKQRQV